jgi:hypothetical protein
MAGRNNYHFAPCGAWARSAGRPCVRKPVLGKDGRPKNGRCPNHGGKSTGAKTPQGKARQAAGRLKLYDARRALYQPRSKTRATGRAKAFVAYANGRRETRQCDPLPEGARMVAARLQVKIRSCRCAAEATPKLSRKGSVCAARASASSKSSTSRLRMSLAKVRPISSHVLLVARRLDCRRSQVASRSEGATPTT